MSLGGSEGESTSGVGAGPGRIGLKVSCVLVLALAALMSWLPPTRAQGVLPESDSQKCAMINLAHYYLRCANVNNALAGLIQEGITKSPSQASQEQRDSAAVMDGLVRDFIEISVKLYKLAGRELTPEIAKARQLADQKDVGAALEWYLSRQVEIMEALAKGQKPKPRTAVPNHIVDLCSRAKLGQEVREVANVDARFLLYHQEAQQLLSKQHSCLK